MITNFKTKHLTYYEHRSNIIVNIIVYRLLYAFISHCKINSLANGFPGKVTRLFLVLTGRQRTNPA